MSIFSKYSKIGAINKMVACSSVLVRTLNVFAFKSMSINFILHTSIGRKTA